MFIEGIFAFALLLVASQAANDNWQTQMFAQLTSIQAGVESNTRLLLGFSDALATVKEGQDAGNVFESTHVDGFCLLRPSGSGDSWVAGERQPPIASLLLFMTSEGLGFRSSIGSDPRAVSTSGVMTNAKTFYKIAFFDPDTQEQYLFDRTTSSYSVQGMDSRVGGFKVFAGVDPDTSLRVCIFESVKHGDVQRYVDTRLIKLVSNQVPYGLTVAPPPTPATTPSPSATALYQQGTAYVTTDPVTPTSIGRVVFAWNTRYGSFADFAVGTPNDQVAGDVLMNAASTCSVDTDCTVPAGTPPGQYAGTVVCRRPRASATSKCYTRLGFFPTPKATGSTPHPCFSGSTDSTTRCE